MRNTKWACTAVVLALCSQAGAFDANDWKLAFDPAEHFHTFLQIYAIVIVSWTDRRRITSVRSSSHIPPP